MATTAVKPGTKRTTVTANEPVTTTNESSIVRNLSVEEFKEDLGIRSFEVVEGPNGRFMSSRGKSIGAVGKNYDSSLPKQVIVLDTDSGELFILCNRGESNYSVVETL